MINFLKNLFGRSEWQAQIDSWQKTDEKYSDLVTAPKAAPSTSPKPEASSAIETDPTVLAHIRAWIDVQARSGFAQLESLFIDLQEVIEDEGLVFHSGWRAEMEAALQQQQEREAAFPTVTANDRLTAAFSQMNQQDLIALENAGYTQSDGWDDLHQYFDEDGQRAKGGVFYHGQDVERSITGAGLNIRFGAFGDQGNNLEIGRQVVEVLKQHGFEPIWNENPNQVIDLPPFEWQRRQNHD